MATARTRPRKTVTQATQKKPARTAKRPPLHGVPAIADEMLRWTEKVALRIARMSRTARRELHPQASTPPKRVRPRAA
jgi:hypothetical protein